MIAWYGSFPDFGQTWGELRGDTHTPSACLPRAGTVHLWCGAVRPEIWTHPLERQVQSAEVAIRLWW